MFWKEIPFFFQLLIWKNAMDVEDVSSRVMTAGTRPFGLMIENQSLTEVNAWDATCAGLYVQGKLLQR